MITANKARENAIAAKSKWMRDHGHRVIEKATQVASHMIEKRAVAGYSAAVIGLTDILDGEEITYAVFHVVMESLKKALEDSGFVVSPMQDSNVAWYVSWENPKEPEPEEEE